MVMGGGHGRRVQRTRPADFATGLAMGAILPVGAQMGHTGQQRYLYGDYGWGGAGGRMGAWDHALGLMYDEPTPTGPRQGRGQLDTSRSPHGLSGADDTYRGRHIQIQFLFREIYTSPQIV